MSAGTPALDGVAPRLLAVPASSAARPAPLRRRPRSALQRLARDRAAWLGASLLLLVVLAALLADWIAPYDYAAQDLARRLAGPSLAHPLGTDHLGRDILSRLIFGARVSLAVGVIAVGLAVLLGVPIGLVAGYCGGVVDLGAMWLMDLLLAFPSLLLAVAIAGVLGPSLPNTILAIGLVGVPGTARLTRAAVLGVRSSAYVEAACASGASAARVLARHILPNILSVVIVRATLGLGAAMLAEAGLSFLGLGAQPPDPSWGGMLSEGRAYLRQSPGLATLPGCCIMASVLAVNLLGDSLRDALDPRG